MKSQSKVCPISGNPLPAYVHGNTKYHPGYKSIAKQQANQDRYEKIKGLSNTALKLDKILGTHYPHSVGQVAIDRKVLDGEGFKWDFMSHITSNAGIHIFWVLEYGYSYYANNKNQIIIHHAG